MLLGFLVLIWAPRFLGYRSRAGASVRVGGAQLIGEVGAGEHSLGVERRGVTCGNAVQMAGPTPSPDGLDELAYTINTPLRSAVACRDVHGRRRGGRLA